MKSLENKFAIVLPNVVLTPTIDRTAVEVEEICKRENFKMFFTSGKRTLEHQMRIIRDYAVSYGLQKIYPEAMVATANDKDKEGNYVWQKLWSQLCNMGLIIAPPHPCIALYDYNYFGRNLKGLVCPPSNHIPGFALDIDGGGNGIEDEVKIIELGIRDKLITTILTFVPERKNNCLHLNCKPI